MKRILILLITALLLSACGAKASDKEVDTIHENIDKLFAEDTKRVLKELEHINENEEPPSEKAIEITERYLEKYEDKEKNEEESEIYRYTSVLIGSINIPSYLESDKTDFRNIRDAILKIIETGKL